MVRYLVCFCLLVCAFTTAKKDNEIDFYIQTANKRPIVFMKTVAASLYETTTFKEVMGFCQLLDIRRNKCENLYFLISVSREHIENTMFELFSNNDKIYDISKEDFHQDLPQIIDLIAQAMTISNSFEYMNVCKSISPTRMSNKNCSIFYKNIDENRDYILKNVYTLIDTSIIVDAKKAKELIDNE